MPVTRPFNAEDKALLDSAFQAEDFAAPGGIIAAVSGGGDSLALLLLLAEFLRARGELDRLAAVTIDHGLRAESAAEAAGVAALCRQAGVKHKIMLWQGAKPGSGLPAAARAARYGLLAQAAAHYQAAVICVAHTLDDQAETYFMRKARLAPAGEDNFALLRQRGLAVMARRSRLFGRFVLLRPLLGARRAALRRFLQRHKVNWFEDPGNSDPAYERARLRARLGSAALREAQQAVPAAAVSRRALSAAAALWGARLALRREGEGLRLDLAPLYAAESSLQAVDYAALYLLLTTAAAMLGGKTFIAADNARLKAFLARLPVLQKGAPPRRISLSGAVLEKRRQHLSLMREKRRFPASAVRPALPSAPLPSAPFRFLVSAYDEPLFALLEPLFPPEAAKTAE